ncbi:glycoside hydrolase family 3 C-terminal domain-containing protein [Mucilaginibacter sp.]|uniref:glycoside hydrolase family 3 C-terminal domain-containing protein n=1 Tax=Mucilaginibacter sp. TaxID=1882438 RepID=UPI0028521858|nr:glycoside hydrolase family 3 C-terminal domain-containing protein [Mucilaginibacter sp.]MDR3696256.1 glycoside hydrolase family 3 C-terminal domain-containing protein [Mucilaginibacter sp.]
MRLTQKPMTALLVLLSATVLTVHAQAQKPLPKLGKSSLKEVVNAMTVEEKAKLVVGMGFKMPGMPPPVKGEKPKPINIGGFTLPPSDPEAYDVPEKVVGTAGRTHAILRLGIPSITVSDGPAGLRIDPTRPNDKRTYYATAFPVATLLASSWDTALVKKVGVAFGNEIREYGVDVILGPALNIHRNPLGGRNFEYYSEDPLVAGSMTAAIVNGIQSQGVGTSIKHFAANNQETNRNSVNTIVSERAMREIYLKGFEIAVKASQPWTVMSSYNRVNGTYTSERRDLQTDILKREWGFKGFVMTDWFGGHDAVAQMNAGNDLLMPGNPDQSDAIVAAVKDGTLTLAQLDANVTRMLKIILKSPTFKGYKYSDKPDLKGHAAVSRTAAAQGMILLKNDGATLPLAKGKKIAVFGNTSYALIAGGTGSGDVHKAYTAMLPQGLANAGIKVQPELAKSYADYLVEAKAKQPKSTNFFMAPPPIPEMDVTGLVEKEADGADAAIITIGRNAGEGADRKVENDFTLTDAEKALINSVSNAFHAKGKKVVVVLNIGGVIEVASWRDSVDGILLAWQPGLEGGNAIADVLSGKVNPSGKLASTFPVAYQDVPSAKNFPGKEFPRPAGQQPNPMVGAPSEVVYQEGVYVGYRYYDSFKIKPAYEFGYGLSYTKFKLSDVKVSTPEFKGSVSISVTVKNTGKAAGKEVVQLYLTAPNQTLDKPAQELKAFAKTGLLAPGQSQVVTLTLHAGDLASFYTDKSAWVADAGEYKVQIGTSSREIAKSVSFKLAKEIVTEKTHKSLTPQVAIEEVINK